jgi:hypothetical protein
MPDDGFFPTETIHYNIVIVLNKDFLVKAGGSNTGRICLVIH